MSDRPLGAAALRILAGESQRKVIEWVQSVAPLASASRRGRELLKAWVDTLGAADLPTSYQVRQA